MDDDTTSRNIKPKIIDFVNRHKSNEVNEIVFYFTGHGEFKDDEFYYLLSDYDPRRRKQTSLENSELDNLLRALGPTLAVKIVDACHSGVPYIKDPDIFGNYLKTTQSEFQKCYFLYSSQTDQYSYQDGQLSFFTKSIVESIANHTTSTIRYKDILDHVSDSFAEGSIQTPFYVIQAEFTEIFCTVTPELQSTLIEILQKGRQHTGPDQKQDKPMSLVDRIREDASRYCSKEEIIECLKSLAEIMEFVTFPEDFSDLYEIEFSQKNSYLEVPEPKAIGTWIEKNGGDYFATSRKENRRVKRRVRRDITDISYLSVSLNSPEEDRIYKVIDVLQPFVVGYTSTVDLPYSHLTILAKARFPNIPGAICYVAPIVSRTHLQAFHSFSTIKEKGWETHEVASEIQWTSLEVPLKDAQEIQQCAHQLMEKFQSFVLTPIRERFATLETEKFGQEDQIISEPKFEALKNESTK